MKDILRWVLGIRFSHEEQGGRVSDEWHVVDSLERDDWYKSQIVDCSTRKAKSAEEIWDTAIMFLRDTRELLNKLSRTRSGLSCLWKTDQFVRQCIKSVQVIYRDKSPAGFWNISTYSLFEPSITAPTLSTILSAPYQTHLPPHHLYSHAELSTSPDID